MKKIFVLLLCISSLIQTHAQIGINTDNANPDSSAILDIKSDSKGVLFPRMTALQRSAINNPATGLMVYQTDTLQGLYQFDGVEWQLVASKFITEQFKAPAPRNWIFKGACNEQFNSSGFPTSSGFVWQSFTAERTGLLVQIDIGFFGGNSVTGPTIRIYEGEGLGGTLLYTSQYGPSSGGWQSYIINTPLVLQAGNRYTINIQDATGSWLIHRGGNVYPGGRASIVGGVDDDNVFRIYATGGEINAFSIDSSAVGLVNNAIWVDEFGNVGINTSTPTSKLDVTGMIRADSFAGDGSLMTNLPPDHLGNHIATQSLDLASNNIINAGTINAISFSGDGSGLTNVKDDLGNHIASTNIQLGSNWLSGDGDNEGIFIDAAGNIGVGITTPDGLIEVLGSGLNAQLKIGGMGGDAHHISSKRDFVFNASNGYLFRSTDYNDLTSFTDLMVIDNSGKVGIRRAAVTNALEVEGNASKTTPGDWLGNSDSRLKTKIQQLDCEQTLHKLLALKGITYEWDDDKTGMHRPEGVQYGFTAQNIQTVFPSLVEEDAQGYLQTAYGTYDAMYVEAIRALHERITHLEEENNELKRQVHRIDQLEAVLETLQSKVNYNQQVIANK